jgi:hypothetical protein
VRQLKKERKENEKRNPRMMEASPNSETRFPGHQKEIERHASGRGASRKCGKLAWAILKFTGRR